jgi:cysteine-rich repeat protein
VRDDGARVPLVLTEPVTIQAFDESSRCRTTCVVPRCGDGILDGGEICDDGNNTGGDGCAMDCKSRR